MPKVTRSTLLRYSAAPAVVLVALLARLPAWDVLGTDIPFLFFWPAVLFCAWYGGLGPGLLATALAALLADYLLFEPRYTFAVAGSSEFVGLSTFVVLGAFLSLLSERVHRTQRAKRQTEAYARKVSDERELLRVTLASIGDGVIVTDAAGRVTFLNGVAEALTGWKQAEAVGQPLNAVFHIVNADTRQPVANPAERVLREGITVELANHTVLLSRRGREIPIDDSAAPVRGDEGEVFGAVLVFRDVSRHKQLEGELRQRLKELAEADRSKNEFLAMLAHELRNPLAAICSALEVFRLEETGDHACQRAREVIDRQAGQLSRLVDDLVDVSRISRGKVKLQKEPVELATVVDRAVESVRQHIDAHRHQLVVRLPSPVRLEADPTRLIQVLANLLTNAAKYTPEGGHIGMTAEREGNEVALRVRDDGIGIPAELLPRVFDLFIQGDRSPARSEGGLGIGLTLVRRLVEMHGGSVQAFSDGPGRGSEFVVRLPALPDGRPPAPSPDQVAAPVATPCYRILIADDNEDLVLMWARMLRRLGHEVSVVHDGQAALDAVETYRPGVLLLDIGLPVVDGLEVARRLQGRPGRENLLVIGISGYGDDERRRQAQEAGFDHLLTKPVKLEAMLGTVRSLLERSGAASAAR